MAGIIQRNPGAYSDPNSIGSEFENIVRYLKSAEKDGLSLGEVISLIFKGASPYPLQIRIDSGKVQYRALAYPDGSNSDWQDVIGLDDLRGAPGINFGEIGAPIIVNRVDIQGDGTRTLFTYNVNTDDDYRVYKDGVLQTPTTDYSVTTGNADVSLNGITFTTAPANNAKITIETIRATSITGYRRVDTVTTESQTVFPYQDAGQDGVKVEVFRNGLLQREGALNDYTVQGAPTYTITFTQPVTSGSVVSFITIENTTDAVVTGMMFERDFTDLEDGLIKQDKIKFVDETLPKSKITGLTTDLDARAKITIGGNTPASPAVGDLWYDGDNLLRAYNGNEFALISPDIQIPEISEEHAGQVITVNGTGTGYVLESVDLSSVIPLTQKGAANGVAQLNASGRLLTEQMPTDLVKDSLYLAVENPTDQTYDVKRIYLQHLSIVGHFSRVNFWDLFGDYFY